MGSKFLRIIKKEEVVRSKKKQFSLVMKKKRLKMTNKEELSCKGLKFFLGSCK